MSRAFVSDKEDWAYCAKAGERCLHADPERDCHKTDCPHYHKAAQPVAKTSGDRTVRRHPGKEASRQPGAAATAGHGGGGSTGSKPAKGSPAGQQSSTGSRPAKGSPAGQQSSTGSRPAKGSPAGQQSSTGSRSSAAASNAPAGPSRRTKRANLKPPKRWGGRSG